MNKIGGMSDSGLYMQQTTLKEDLLELSRNDRIVHDWLTIQRISNLSDEETYLSIAIHLARNNTVMHEKLLAFINTILLVPVVPLERMNKSLPIKSSECLHHWAGKSPCPYCQDIIIQSLVKALRRISLGNVSRDEIGRIVRDAINVAKI